MRLDHLRVGLPRSKSQPLAPLVRHERLRKPREGSELPGAKARRARLGRRSRATERGDDALAVHLEDPLFLAAHRVDVELAFIAGPAASRASGFARERHPTRYLLLEADRAVRRPRQCRNRTGRTPRPQRTRTPRWVGHVSRNDAVLDDQTSSSTARLTARGPNGDRAAGPEGFMPCFFKCLKDVTRARGAPAARRGIAAVFASRSADWLDRRRGFGTGERGDDLLAVDLEDPLLLTAHEVNVELTDPDSGELPQFFDVLLDLAGHTKTIDRLVVDERRVR